MRKVKKVQREIEETDDIICNKCGSSLKVFIDRDKKLFNFVGLCEVEVSGSYASKHIEDGTKYRFSMCEKCCRELMDTFKISAEEIDCLFGDIWG